MIVNRKKNTNKETQQYRVLLFFFSLSKKNRLSSKERCVIVNVLIKRDHPIEIQHISHLSNTCEEKNKYKNDQLIFEIVKRREKHNDFSFDFFLHFTGSFERP